MTRITLRPKGVPATSTAQGGEYVTYNGQLLRRAADGLYYAVSGPALPSKLAEHVTD